MNKVSQINLEVGTSTIGEVISIKKFEIKSDEPGKTVYVQGGIHGGEITLPIIRKLYDFLKNNLISGKVILIPYANPVSWRQRIYSYTMGKFNFQNGKDFNRVFGQPGEGDINNQIAHVLLQQCEGVDFAFDLHTARESTPYTIFSALEYAKYVKLLGVPFNHFCEPVPEYTNTFDVQLLKRNIPNTVIECGSHDQVNHANINKIFDGIVNLLRSFKMVAGDVKEFGDFKYFKNTHHFYAPVGGIVDFKKDVGQTIKKGETLFTMMQGNLAETEVCVDAPEDAIMLKISKSHICDAHDEVADLIYLKDLSSL